MRRRLFTIGISLVITGCTGSMWATLESPYGVYSPDSAPLRIDWQKRYVGAYPSLASLYAGRDGRTFWAVGEEGTILRTDDGRSWVPQSSGTSNSLNGIAGAEDGSLWAVGDEGTILHSPDGQRWETVNSGTSRTLFAVFTTPDGRSQWAVGDEGTILHKLSGSAWTPQPSGTTASLYAVRGTSDGKLVWATGAGGTILRSSDDATWTAQLSTTVDDLDALHVADDGTVWAAGSRAEKVVRSRDGTTWEAQERPLAGITALVSGTPTTQLWATTRDGSILYTVDGERWMGQPIGVLPEPTTPDDNPFVDPLQSLVATADGRKLWAIGAQGTVLEGSVAGRVPYLSDARLRRGLDGVSQIEFTVVCPDPYDDQLLLDVRGPSPLGFTTLTILDRWHPTQCAVDPVRFDPAALNVRSGDTLYFEISVLAGDVREFYTFSTVYDPWQWFREHRALLALAGTFLSLVSLFTTVLYTKPLWNLRLYRTLNLARVESVSGASWIGAPLQLVLKTLMLLPWFIRHRRTLDAWVAHHAPRIRHVWEAESHPGLDRSAVAHLASSTAYVPLPVRIGGAASGRTLEPSADAVGAFFGRGRNVIQIVGPGGAGKTTLARQIGRWALEGGRRGSFADHPVLPIWLDEDLDAVNNSIVTVVKGKLSALLPDEVLDDELVEALLRTQRVLVIVDRLSEHSLETQKYLERIYRSASVHALVITTRRECRVEGASPVLLYPEPLSDANLLRFMTSVLQNDASSERMNAPTLSLADQLALAERVVALFESTRIAATEKTPMLPLPVRLFVEEAKRLMVNGRALSELPLSVPAVYFNYLEQVNPAGVTGSNLLTASEMLRAATLLARCSLGDDFVPKPFLRQDATDLLRQHGWANPQALDPIQRLIDNGVLLERKGTGYSRVWFALDPIAETLDATARVRACKGDPDCLARLRVSAARAPGYLSAMDLVHVDGSDGVASIAASDEQARRAH
ncbi:MAG: hypothetical protein AB7N65_12735 [Vicinamibacterales bacterium]